MKRATKTLLAVGGILVLSYPGIAWVTGVAIESRIQHDEQRAVAQVPYLTLVSREYHRGVYESTETATYGFRIPALQAMGAAAGTPLRAGATITVASNIRHGPFPGLRVPALAIVDSTLVVPPAARKVLSGILGSKPILEVRTSVGFFGGASASLTSPAFSLRLPDGCTIR